MKIAAVGDVFLGDQLACLGFGVRSYCDRHGYDHLFDGIRARLKGHDLAVANLESVLSQAQGSERHSLHAVLNRGSPVAAGAIKNAGIRLLTLANNHIFDYGSRGLDDTIAALEDAGLWHCGSASKSIHTHQHDGRHYAFLSWSMVPDSAYSQRFYNTTRDPEPIFVELRKARLNADKLVLSLHAGNEFIGQPSLAFQSLCREFVDAGADVILGHHPHVLQPLEYYKHGLIVYSLGNCVFCSWDIGCRTGMVLGASIDDARCTETAFFEIDNRTYAPASITDEGRLADLAAHVRSPKPLPEADYLSLVRKLRVEYRAQTVRYVLKNLYRTKWRLALCKIALNRLRYLWSIRKVERDRPNLVYAGQAYVQCEKDL
jgi:poly-gamma-glutamate capsule biosynthesis protein CapA/YwtB (metallophosphatase superfamily)